jgi:hypothetical protein
MDHTQLRLGEGSRFGQGTVSKAQLSLSIFTKIIIKN